DKGTGRVISKGVFKDGLYQLEDTVAVKDPEVAKEPKTIINTNKDSLLALVLPNVIVNNAYLPSSPRSSII
ncbi:unnamed protein product, partial [Citrullus colocynthis]